MSEPSPLYRQLLHLTEQACSRLSEANREALAPLLVERQAVIESIQALTPPPDPHAIRQVLDLDRKLLDFLETEKARIAEALAEISKCRQLLESYHGAPPRSAVYVERLG